MTPAEKTKLLAERVMGWQTRESADGEIVAVIKDGECTRDVGFTPFSWTSQTWQPLTKLANAGEVLEAMRAKGWHADMGTVDAGYCVEFANEEIAYPHAFSSLDRLFATAICHAALLAVGVEEEEL